MTDRPNRELEEPKAGGSESGQGLAVNGITLNAEVIDQVAALIDEFGLSRVDLKSDSFRVAFGKETATIAGSPVIAVGPPQETFEVEEDLPEAPAQLALNLGIPVSSPMTGIFYSRANPGSPPFASEGSIVTAGQVVCLIEAMKVFNEITAPVSGTVSRIGPKDGDVVQPGEMLVSIQP